MSPKLFAQRMMGIVGGIVQALPNSDNEFRVTVFNADTDEVLVDCGSGIFGLTDEKETEA
jgi:hypothetical protein